jgi:hypothetical protein
LGAVGLRLTRRGIPADAAQVTVVTSSDGAGSGPVDSTPLTPVLPVLATVAGVVAAAAAGVDVDVDVGGSDAGGSDVGVNTTLGLAVSDSMAICGSGVQGVRLGDESSTTRECKERCTPG